MKKLITVSIILVSMLITMVPVLAANSPTYSGNFVSTENPKGDITTPENTNTEFDDLVNHKGKFEHTHTDDNCTFGDGGIIIIKVNYDYKEHDDKGAHSIHTDDQGNSFYKDVANDIVNNNRVKDDENWETSIVDIHVWYKNIVKEDVPIPNSFTVKADVKKGDKVLVHHYVNNTTTELISKDRVKVEDGKITVTGVTDLSLWAFTKITKKTPAQSGGSAEYNPPRTDVE